ncbi:AMP-binding protein [Nonomuraea sp. NPDC049421]|uniref:AMP-binding protein n=1 Tax=Nonomuraea sp. NPDC049421 TaxID=3155275 RepID=UPI003441AAF6
MDVSFATIWEAVARRLPGAVAVQEPGRELTYAEFDDRAARLAEVLVRAGVGPGGRVACYLHNGAAYLEAVFAALKIGAVPVNANYRYTGKELSGLLTDAEAEAIVFSGSLAAGVEEAARTVPSLRLLVRVDRPGQAAAHEQRLLDVPGRTSAGLDDLIAATPPRPAEPRPGSDQLFLYTGGTTGRPKGVVWRLTDLLHSLAVPVFGPLGVQGLPATLEEAVEIAVAAHEDGRAPVTLPVAPLMHATGLFNAMGALLTGGRVVTTRPGGLDARHVWETVAERRVRTVIVAGNAVCAPLVAELQAGRSYDLSSLTSLISSGTALSDDLKQVLHERADVTIFDAIASSEGGPFAFAVTSSAADLPARFFPVPGTKVITPGGRRLTPGSDETGVLAYAGPMPLGYHGDPVRTAATYRVVDGVRHAIPGDLARLEADGAIRFLGRGSSVINTGGEKVYPQEVETALLAHPDVTDCVVVGLPDETWGERVAAVVATASPALTEDVLREWARKDLAGYKVPRHILLRPALPRSPAGKLELAWARRVLTDHGSSGRTRCRPRPGSA